MRGKRSLRENIRDPAYQDFKRNHPKRFSIILILTLASLVSMSLFLSYDILHFNSHDRHIGLLNFVDLKDKRDNTNADLQFRGAKLMVQGALNEKIKDPNNTTEGNESLSGYKEPNSVPIDISNKSEDAFSKTGNISGQPDLKLSSNSSRNETSVSPQQYSSGPSSQYSETVKINMAESSGDSGSSAYSGENDLSTDIPLQNQANQQDQTNLVTLNSTGKNDSQLNQSEVQMDLMNNATNYNATNYNATNYNATAYNDISEGSLATEIGNDEIISRSHLLDQTSENISPKNISINNVSLNNLSSIIENASEHMADAIPPINNSSSSNSSFNAINVVQPQMDQLSPSSTEKNEEPSQSKAQSKEEKDEDQTEPLQFVPYQENNTSSGRIAAGSNSSILTKYMSAYNGSTSIRHGEIQTRDTSANNQSTEELQPNYMQPDDINKSDKGEEDHLGVINAQSGKDSHDNSSLSNDSSETQYLKQGKQQQSQLKQTDIIPRKPDQPKSPSMKQLDDMMKEDLNRIK